MSKPEAIIDGDLIQHTATISATGNYSIKYDQDGNEVIDENRYNEWKNTKFFVNGESSELNVKVSGELSLCQAFMPRENLEVESMASDALIPRVNESASPLNVIFDENRMEDFI